MQCSQCNKTISNTSKFCRYCGAPIQVLPTLKKKEFISIKFYVVVSAIALAFMLVVGCVLYPKPISMTVEGSYSDTQRSLVLANTGEATFIDIDGMEYTGTYTISNDVRVLTLGLINEQGATIEMQAFFEEKDLLLFQKKSSYEAIRYRLSSN